jgi:HAE1 family hydrophobic/amphiphilic exporter-1
MDLKKRQRYWYERAFWSNAFAGRQENNQQYFTQFDIQSDARQIMKEYPDLRVAVQDVSLFAGAGVREAMIEFCLRGPNLDKLQQYSEQIMGWMKQQRYEGRPAYVDVDNSLSMRKPELRVKIDRERASDLGIPVQIIATTLNVLVGGEPVSKYKETDEQYDVWLRAELPFRENQEQIRRLMIPAPKAGLVQLSSLASLESAKGPATIDRFGLQRQVVVTANLETGKALGDTVSEMSQFVNSINLPADYRWEFVGKAKVLGESNNAFLIGFLASFLFMYMVLAAQFESFIHPITILLALPLTLPFAILSLVLLRTNLDIYAMFGLFMLFGIVKKNGILQVDYTNVLRARGLPRNEAILEANHTRLRPILMTTVMLIAAMVPIALGRGPGAASRASLAKVVLGGQALSLLLTLLVTPVAYSLWDDVGRLWRRVTGWLFGRKEERLPATERESQAPSQSPLRAPTEGWSG